TQLKIVPYLPYHHEHLAVLAFKVPNDFFLNLRWLLRGATCSLQYLSYIYLVKEVASHQQKKRNHHHHAYTHKSLLIPNKSQFSLSPIDCNRHYNGIDDRPQFKGL